MVDRSKRSLLAPHGRPNLYPFFQGVEGRHHLRVVSKAFFEASKAIVCATAVLLDTRQHLALALLVVTVGDFSSQVVADFTLIQEHLQLLLIARGSACSEQQGQQGQAGRSTHGDRSVSVVRPVRFVGRSTHIFDDAVSGANVLELGVHARSRCCVDGRAGTVSIQDGQVT